MDLTFHHTGIVVKSIEAELEHYILLFGKENISKKTYISSQKVNVCFINIGNDAFFELVEPIGEDSAIGGLVKKNVSYYHTGFLTTNIEKTVNILVSIGYKPLDYFNSEAFEKRKCIFLFSPNGMLIECIEKT